MLDQEASTSRAAARMVQRSRSVAVRHDQRRTNQRTIERA